MALVAASAATISLDLHVSLSLSLSVLHSKIGDRSIPPSLPSPWPRLAQHTLTAAASSSAARPAHGCCCWSYHVTARSARHTTPLHLTPAVAITSQSRGNIVIDRRRTVALVVIRRATSFPEHIAKITELSRFVRMGWLHLHTGVLLGRASGYWSYTRR